MGRGADSRFSAHFFCRYTTNALSPGPQYAVFKQYASGRLRVPCMTLPVAAVSDGPPDHLRSEPWMDETDCRPLLSADNQFEHPHPRE